MIGKLDTSHREVTIIGAGIAGLLSAYYLDQKGWKVRLIEANSQAGGLLSSHQSQYGLVESGAHSIPASPGVVKHFQELGIKLLPLNENAKGRYILKNGRPRKMPLNIFELVAAFFRAYFKLAPARDPESLNLAEWAEHFLGKPARKYLITPFTRGIFGAEPEEVLVSAAFPQLCVPRGHSLLSFFLAKKVRKNPPIAVKRKLVKIPRGAISTPENGVGEWARILSAHLENRLGERFEKNRTVESLTEFNNEKNIILAVPAHVAAKLLGGELASRLKNLRYAPLITSTVFVERRNLENNPQGLGVLMPREENRKTLGILYNSSAFSSRVKNPEHVSFTVMLGGSGNAEMLTKSDSEIRAFILNDLRELFGLTSEPLELKIKRWPEAVPTYNRDLLETWALAEETWCAEIGHILFGNYTGQVSLRGMIELASNLG